MVAVKAAEAERFCSNIDHKILAILFYGPDIGLVAERATRVAKMFAAREDPPSEILRIDDVDLDAEPDRLLFELGTVSMFSNGKVIRTTASRKVSADHLAASLDPTTMSATLVVEAGNLRADDKLRKLFEKHKFTAAVPCYTDGVRDLSNVVDDVFASAGQRIERDARDLLISRLGADRSLSRNEVEKLSLYALGKETIDSDDVEQIVGDASELTIDRITSAAASGNTAAAVSEFQRATASGENAQYIISATLNYFQRLHRIRAEIETGKNFDDVTRRLRPPLHFKTKAAVQAQTRNWQLQSLTRAIALINVAALNARLSATLEHVIAERMLIDVSRIVARK